MGQIKLNGLIDSSNSISLSRVWRMASVRRFKRLAVKSWKRAHDFNCLPYFSNGDLQFLYLGLLDNPPPPLASAKPDIYVTWQMDVDPSANEVENKKTGPFVLSSVRASALTGHSCPLEACINALVQLKCSWQLGLSLYLTLFVSLLWLDVETGPVTSLDGLLLI